MPVSWAALRYVNGFLAKLDVFIGSRAIALDRQHCWNTWQDAQPTDAIRRAEDSMCGTLIKQNLASDIFQRFCDKMSYLFLFFQPVLWFHKILWDSSIEPVQTGWIPPLRVATHEPRSQCNTRSFSMIVSLHEIQLRAVLSRMNQQLE